MSTAELIPPRGMAARRSAARGGRNALPSAVAAALLLVLLYAAFSHGAVSLATEARVQVAVSVLAAIAGAGWLWTGTFRIAAPRAALCGAGMLVAFAAWSGVSLLWSVAPDQTWIELNRTICYALVLWLAIGVGGSHRQALRLAAGGVLGVSLALTAYGLAQKLAPGFHVSGLFDFNQTGVLPRLQEPLGYWNALALLIALGVPIALAIAVDRERPPRIRLALIGAIAPMLLAIGFTESRGAVLALATAIAISVGLGAAPLRSLMWLGIAVLAAIPPLVFGLTSHSLTAARVALSTREVAGSELLAVLAASLLVFTVLGRRVLALEARAALRPERARAIWRLLGGLTALLLMSAIIALAASPRGLGGTISHAWKSFTATRATSNYDPHRLLSADSENRWVWWKEAAGAFSDRPVAGWGAGSFPVVHLLYRRDTLTVQQPHSVPLQFLAETGIVGTLLAVGALALLLAAAVRSVRRRPLSSERLLASALLAGTVAYAVHSLYDWDWDIPALTLPALVFAGVLVGSAHRDSPLAGQRWLAPVRVLALGMLTAALCVIAVSASLPSLAASKAGAALVAASGSSMSQLQQASATAALASSLDPLSDAGLRAQATIAIHRGQPVRARQYLLQAVRRNPTDVVAWNQLGFIELALADRQAAVRAAMRALDLDPRSSLAITLLRVNYFSAPPWESPTAIRTPQAGP